MKNWKWIHLNVGCVIDLPRIWFCHLLTLSNKTVQVYSVLIGIHCIIAPWYQTHVWLEHNLHFIFHFSGSVNSILYYYITLKEHPKEFALNSLLCDLWPGFALIDSMGETIVLETVPFTFWMVPLENKYVN